MSSGPVPFSQKEYLKKYLIGSDGGKKKKKKQKVISSSSLKRSQIIDDDIDLKGMRALNDDEVDIYQLDENAPQIVGIIDERPAEIKAQEYYDTKRWKVFATDDDSGDIKVIDQQKDSSVNSSKHAQNEDVSSKQAKPLVSNYGNESDSDQSLPRQSPKNVSRSRKDDSDPSPPRKSSSKSNHSKVKELESSEKRKHSVKGESDSDLSPPRTSKLDYKRESKNRDGSSKQFKTQKSHRDSDNDSDLSPVRKSNDDRKYSSRWHESDSDFSPPRKSSKSERYSGHRSRPSDLLKGDKLKSKRDDTDSDLSPSRKTSKSERYGKSRDKRENKYSSDRQRERRSSSGSPPRNSKKFSNRQEYRKRSRSPPRKATQKDYLRGREENKSDSDQSPPRKSSYNKYAAPNRKQRSSESDSPKAKFSSNSPEKMKKNKMEKTLDGKRAGLQDAQNLKTELADFKNKEDQLFSKMNASVSGEGAAPILRDRKTGKIRDLQAEKVIDKEKAAKDDVRKEKYTRWGKGLKQVEDAAERLADAMKEMNKPLARYADDEDLDKFLKAQEREGDPMLDYIKKKQGEAIALSGQKPQYQGASAPNRFGIRPGHRWDGVDRSNGFEKKWFTQQNAKKARDEEAYKWSTSDM